MGKPNFFRMALILRSYTKDFTKARKPLCSEAGKIILRRMVDIVTRVNFLRLAMALLPALFLAACDESKPLKSVDLKLSWRHGADFLGFYVAVKKDYFAQEGLEVHIHPLSDPKELKEVFDKVTAGEIDFSTAGV